MCLHKNISHCCHRTGGEKQKTKSKPAQIKKNDAVHIYHHHTACVVRAIKLSVARLDTSSSLQRHAGLNELASALPIQMQLPNKYVQMVEGKKLCLLLNKMKWEWSRRKGGTPKKNHVWWFLVFWKADSRSDESPKIHLE